MDWSKLLYELIEVCLIPALGILTTYLVKYFKAKIAESVAQTNNDVVIRYLQLAEETISRCVIATNQTYVEALKAQGKFDINAQKEAFKRTYDAVMNILNDEAKTYLATIYGDVNLFITKAIEEQVNNNK